MKLAIIIVLLLAACGVSPHSYTEYFDACRGTDQYCTMLALQACDVYGCQP